MTITKNTSRPLQVAVIGAGPGGLGAAIAFHRLQPDVEVRVYEQARELREIGAGIHIMPNTWNILKILGASEYLTSYYRSPVKGEHRNGRTGEILRQAGSQLDEPIEKCSVRTQRTKLQQALLAAVPKGLVNLNKKLVELEQQGNRVFLRFEDGSTDEVDLVIGADGVRSVVRHYAFPEHQIKYTGIMSYRTLADFDRLKHIPDLPDSTIFWHGKDGWLFTTEVGDNIFEVSARTVEPKDEGYRVSWGQDCPVSQAEQHFKDYCSTVRAIIASATSMRQYPNFSGTRVESLVKNGSIALVGDASHPLAGAFGAGAAFALEDAYILSQAVKYALSQSRPLSYALELFNKTRLPHYEAMYKVISRNAENAVRIKANSDLGVDERIAALVQENWDPTPWIYEYDVEKAWNETLHKEEIILNEDSGELQ